MAGWISRLAVVAITLLATACAGGALLGAASAETQVTELLVYLSTRFWGAPLAGDELTKWKGFFTQAATRAETIKQRDQAFAAMCIALMTDPRFLTY